MFQNQIISLGSISSATHKRKRGEIDTDAPTASEVDDAERPGSDVEINSDDEEDEHKTPKGRKPRPKASPKNKSSPIAKKPRAGKSALPKVTKTKARRGRKPKGGEDPYDADQVAKDAKISADNPLFSEQYVCFNFFHH